LWSTSPEFSATTRSPRRYAPSTRLSPSPTSAKLEQLERLKNFDRIEARFSDRHIALSVFAFDDEMIVTPHLANLVGHESPMLHLSRCQQDGAS